MNATDQTLIHVAVPLGVFIISLVLSYWLMIRGLRRLSNWAKVQEWPAETIIYSSVREPIMIFSVALSVFLGLIVSIISREWKDRIIASFGTLITFIIVLATLEIIQRATSHFSKRVNLPGAGPAIRWVLSIGLGAVGILLVFGFWGAPTNSILVLICIILVGIVLILRDSGPDYVAAFEISLRDHITLNENVKLQGGEKGKVNKLGWRNVELLTQGGDTIVIPNSKFLRQIVTKLNTNMEAPVGVEAQSPSLPASVESLGREKDINLLAILSRRENEIAILVAEGITNREIAEKLFISENTVKVHIQNILKKLELKNRQQIAFIVASYQKNRSN